MEFNKIESMSVDWIHLKQDMDHTSVNTIMNLQDTEKMGTVLSSWTTMSF
jgi:hypothetical protein